MAVKHAIKRRPGARRRGVVLIMVVAVLGILFVSGVALLTMVTFSTKTLNAEKVARENRDAVDAVERVVFDLMREGFLSPEGRPYSPPAFTAEEKAAFGEVVLGGPSDGDGGMFLPSSQTGVNRPRILRLPAYGENLGVHPWIDPSEPYETGVDCTISNYSHLGLALQRRAGVDPRVAADVALFDDPYQNLQPLWLHALHTQPQREQVMDADGDGIPDSYTLRIPDGVLPSNLRLSLADRLRDPKYAGADPGDLYLSLKVIPHGSMVNLNAAIPQCTTGAPQYPDVLVGSLLGFDPVGYTGLASRLHTPYLPQSNEGALRNRGGCIVPRALPTTRLVTDLTEELLRPHALEASADVSTLAIGDSRRWWQYDRNTLNDYDSSVWRQMMDAASPKGVYDANHLITTISHDDQLIRSGRSADSGTDWIEEMMADARTDHWIDNYPFQLDDERHLRDLVLYADAVPGLARDPRLGRMKVSFPYFSTIYEMGGGLPGGTTISDLSAMNPVEREAIIWTIQDAFSLMLRNYVGFVDFDSNGELDYGPSDSPGTDDDALSMTAAMLTANLIDFADMDDGQNLPTEVIVRDWRTGQPIEQPTGQFVRVYGLERQPYITEVYRNVTWIGTPFEVDTNVSMFAIELYNPYDVPMSLDGYSLTDAAEPAQITFLGGESVNRLSEVGLGDLPDIAPRSFLVVYPDGISTAITVTPPSQVIQLDDKWFVDRDSRIQLKREFNALSGATSIVVDEFNVTIDVKNLSAPSGIGESDERSWERDSTNASDGLSNWRFVVPRAWEDKTAHTVGGSSNYNSEADPAGPIRSVHIDFADRHGTLRSAFPTTGSMLLLMRHAHLVDPDASDPIEKKGVPFNRVHNNRMADDFDQIDNGRMPVFDEAMKYHVSPSTTPGSMQGVEALPWGQLVFDYFTALPLGPEDDPCVDTLLPQGYPPVDQDGLRVSGRININTAPWTVMAGLPYVGIDHFQLPNDMAKRIWDVVGQTPPASRWLGSQINPLSDKLTDIGRELAESIVAYRDARDRPELPGGAYDFGAARGPLTTGTDLSYRRGYGFLTVGELLNVRPTTWAGSWVYGIDGLEVSEASGTTPTGDYLSAVARMVLLSDWVTTKSHVFTVYGTLRGQYIIDDTDPGATAASIKEVDRRAIRFQSTVDRLPMLFGREVPSRVGSRVVENYTDVRGE